MIIRRKSAKFQDSESLYRNAAVKDEVEPLELP